MAKKILFFFFMLVVGFSDTNLHAQYYRNENKIWRFGTKATIDFTSGVAQGSANNISSIMTEGNATVCDSDGKLLFTSDGTNVWDANDNLMPNGGFITGLPNNPTMSTTQGSVIAPVPDSPGQYFIFSMPDWVATAHFGKLFCNKVNMNLNGGLGDVDTTFPLRHQVLDSLFTERMTVVASCGFNWLLLVRRDTIMFKAFKITSSGLDPVPVVSRLGYFPEKHYRQGTLKASHNGKMLVNSCFRANNGSGPGFEIYDFDPITGIVSNARILDSLNSYSAAFSPDDSKLYMHFSESPATSAIYQFDLSLGSLDAIKRSKTFLGIASAITDIRLAPDGKIYFGRDLRNSPVLGCINYPDSLGVAAGYQDSVIVLPRPASVYHGLPQAIIIESLYPDTLFNDAFNSTICPVTEPLLISAPEGSTHHLWGNGDTSATISIDKEGTYIVYYKNPCPTIDTFVFTIDFPQWAIAVSENVLQPNMLFDTYQWYKDGVEIEGATNAKHEVKENGLYVVKVSLNDCYDTSSYRVNNATAIDDYANSQLQIFPNPAHNFLHIQSAEAVNVNLLHVDGRILKTSNQHAGILDISDLADGIYWLQIYNKNQILLHTQKVVKLAK